MCGLLGMMGPPVPADGKAEQLSFRQSLDLLVHRGPDSSGLHFDTGVMLGHRRLAIVDLSPGGHQPMVDVGTGMVLVFNGEIYNYREIRQELLACGVAFRSDSDTEVLLRAFIEWGTECFPRLNGMWAAAFWDPVAQELVLSRDRFGVKPLYYAVHRDRLMFGSEPKALLSLAPDLAEPDPNAIASFFVDSISHAGEGSFLAGIRSLPAGTWARVHLQNLRVRPVRYWEYPEAQTAREGGSEDMEEFAALIEDAVRLRLRSDVPVAITLSGGLDSTAILEAAKATGLVPDCLTSVYGDGDTGELAWAQVAAQHASASLEQVSADSGDWTATLQRIVWHMDSPGYSPAVFPLWTIMAHARAHGHLVLLEGQGADELLGGYTQYAVLALLGQIRAGVRLADLVDQLRGLSTMVPIRMAALWMARLAFAPIAGRLGPARARRRMLLKPDYILPEAGLPQLPSSHDPLHRALFADHSKNVLPALLHYGDAISMAHGIESRLPFMDYRIVEWVFRSQPNIINNGWTKWPVRQYLHRRGQSEIALRRDKKGYATPLGRWMTSPDGSAFFQSMLDAGSSLRDYFDLDRVRPLVRAARAGDAMALNHCYKLLTTKIWLDQLQQARVGAGIAPMTPVAAGQGFVSAAA
jgi:asparagine synthase (glutamine-hydrolysing)